MAAAGITAIYSEIDLLLIQLPLRQDSTSTSLTTEVCRHLIFPLFLAGCFVHACVTPPPLSTTTPHIFLDSSLENQQNKPLSALLVWQLLWPPNKSCRIYIYHQFS